MNWKKWNPISSVKLMGIFALIIVSGIGVMTVMSLQAEGTSGTVTANLVEGRYYRTLYGASDYMYPSEHDGSPFVYDLVNYEGRSLDLTLTPKVLAIDSVYLMRISDYCYSQEGAVKHPSSDGASYIRDPTQDIIKIAEYDFPTNIISLGVIDIPENNDDGSSWWLVCFCINMGYRGTPENNPDGRVIIDIVVG